MILNTRYIFPQPIKESHFEDKIITNNDYYTSSLSIHNILICCRSICCVRFWKIEIERIEKGK